MSPAVKKHGLAALALAAWFFGLRMEEGNLPGVYVQMIFGPFATKEQCVKVQTVYEGMFNRAGMTLDKVIECKFLKDS